MATRSNAAKREYNRDVREVRSVKGAVVFKVSDDAGMHFQSVLWHPNNDGYLSKQVRDFGINFNGVLNDSVRAVPVFLKWGIDQAPELSYVFGRIVRGKHK